MPNWTQNKLVVTGPKEALDHFIVVASGKRNCFPAGYETNLEAEHRKPNEKTPLVFDCLRPVPLGLLARTYGAEKEKESGGAELIDGCASAYDWCINYWGTKWEPNDLSFERTSDKRAVYRFDTAWAPPTELYEFVSKAFPMLTFVSESRQEEDGYKEKYTLVFEGGKTVKSNSKKVRQ